MFTAPAPSFTDWKKVLLNIGLKEAHITDDLIVILSAHGFRITSINTESFQGYYSGASEHEAGTIVAQEFASLNSLQEFLMPIIDWEQAWDSLKMMERYILVKTKELNTWALFMLE